MVLGVDDLQTIDIKAALFGSGLHGLDLADENGREEAVLLQTGCGLEDTRVGALGVNDLAGIGLEDLNEIFKHLLCLQ